MRDNLSILFNPASDLKQWIVGPPYLKYSKKRKVATVHVLNKGNRILEDCAAFLEIIKSDMSTLSGRQLPLHWADTPYDALSSSITPVKINPSMEHRLDVVFSEEREVTISGCSVASAQALATGVQEDQFYLKPGEYLVRVTVVSGLGDKAQGDFVIQSHQRWQDLSMKSITKNLPLSLLEKWHSLNLSAPVIGALATIATAFIGGIFLLVNTIISHNFFKTEPQEKIAMSVGVNTGYVQQQKAETIINNLSTADRSSLIPTLETILQLGYLSIWTNDGGSRQSYETLLSWEKDERIEPNLKRQISSEIKKIQEKYYIVPLRWAIDNEDGGRLAWRWICKCKSSPEARDCSNGIEPSKEFDAENVIAHLYKTAPETPWQERARAACIVRNIRTAYNKDNINKKEFFERLVALMSENERSLCVSKMAFETYKDLTGFRPKLNEVFAFEEAIENWNQNKEAVLKIEF